METLEEAIRNQIQFSQSEGKRGRMFGVSGPRPAQFDLRGSTFLAEQELVGAYLDECDLSGSDLRGFQMAGGSLGDAFLRSVNAEGSYFRKCFLEGADFTEAILTSCGLVKCEASGAIFEGATLDGSRLLRPTLTESTFARASLAHVQVSRVIVDAINIEQTVCTGLHGTVIRPRKSHPSWDGLDIVSALKVRGATDVSYFDPQSVNYSTGADVWPDDSRTDGSS